jgi:hypothetical protein
MMLFLLINLFTYVKMYYLAPASLTGGIVVILLTESIYTRIYDN